MAVALVGSGTSGLLSVQPMYELRRDDAHHVPVAGQSGGVLYGPEVRYSRNPSGSHAGQEFLIKPYSSLELWAPGTPHSAPSSLTSR